MFRELPDFSIDSPIRSPALSAPSPKGAPILGYNHSETLNNQSGRMFSRR